ncbi:MAG: hypothetical protein ACI350_05640 [Prevotella sp.]
MDINDFRIAEFPVRIIFNESSINSIRLVPSLEPFRTPTVSDDWLFQLNIDDSTVPVPKSKRQRIKDFETGNGKTIVDRIEGGGYQFIIKDLCGRDCCLLITNKSFDSCICALNGNEQMRRFGLNNAIIYSFTFAASARQTVLIHASLVRHNGYGYAFNARSGTGKSTHVSLWLDTIPGCDLMNDDNPVIRIIDGQAYIYGSPWSGKTPCYRNVKARLGAITRIDRATENSIEKETPVKAFASILPSCSSMIWDSEIYNNICSTITEIVNTTDIYTLHCLPNKEAAILCHKTISK